jgi:hypothetical protein
VEGFVPPIEALFDERAKHSVLLVEVVEESANMTVLAERGPGTSHGTAVDSMSKRERVAGRGHCQLNSVESTFLAPLS